MNKFDQHIKDKLSTPQAPPLEAWGNIEQKLEPQKKRRIIPLFYWIASGAACIGIIAVVYQGFKEENTINSKELPPIVKSEIKDSSSEKDHQLSDKNKNSIDVTNIEYNPDHIALNLEQQNISDPIKNNQKNNAQKTININQNLYDLWDELGIIANQNSGQNSKDKQTIIVQNNQSESTLKEELDEPLLEDLLKEKEEIKPVIKEIPKAKLMIASHYSPSLILNNRSVLTDTYNPEHIENQIAANFGAKVSYSVSDRLRISTGIAKMNINQHTLDVVASQTSILPLTSAAQNVSSIVSTNIKYNNSIRLQNEVSVLSEVNVKKETGKINQRIEFIEIPLDLEYSLFRKNKFSLDALVGASLFLLSKNEIALTTPSFNRELIGSATNIHENSISTKTGIKISYDVTRDLGIHVQPNFRIMWNTFENINQRSTSLFDFNVGVSYKILK